MTTARLIRKRIEKLPTGQPFTAAKFLTIAERSNVDKTLMRLVSKGVLSRPARGVFVRPESSKLGEVPPDIIEIAKVKARGNTVQVSGAEAARRFGLSTQVPVRPVYCTTGNPQKFNVGKIPVRLKHVSPRKLVYPNTKVGMAISALWYLGKEQVDIEVFKTIHSQLSSTEYSKLKAAASQMPAWMSDTLHRYEKERASA